ncbi:hypothetical protein WJX77_011125 [Trebouxia sp. C0004]
MCPCLRTARDASGERESGEVESPPASANRGSRAGQRAGSGPPDLMWDNLFAAMKATRAGSTSLTDSVANLLVMGPWQQLFGGMKLLRTYNQGSNLFAAPVGGGGSNRVALGPAPWAVEIWYDAPAPAIQVNSVSSDAHDLLFTFAGHVGGAVANVAVDNCATHSFYDHAFAVKHGLDVQPCSGDVICAGTESVPIKGYVNVHVQVQSLSEVVKLLVIDLSGGELHAILGQTWLSEHQAVI